MSAELRSSQAGANSGTYSSRQVEEMVGLHRASLAVMVRAGVVTPKAGAFTEDDVQVLRTAVAFQQAGVPPRKVVNALARLRRSLGPGRHLASVRLKVRGNAIQATDAEGRDVHANRTGRVEVWTGHRLIAFDDLAGPGLQRTDAQAYVDRAGELEHSDMRLAEAAYRKALALDPTLEAAYLNLGAMLCEQRDCQEALDLYDAALSHGVSTALLHFHRGLALEDLDRHPHAAEAHHQAIALDPELADAHYHLGLLAERGGDAQAALRHFGEYKRLRPEEPAADAGDSEWPQS